MQPCIGVSCQYMRADLFEIAHLSSLKRHIGRPMHIQPKRKKNREGNKTIEHRYLYRGSRNWAFSPPAESTTRSHSTWVPSIELRP